MELEELFLSLSLGERGGCYWWGWDETHWRRVWFAVGHQGVGEGKGPERLTEDGRQCHGGMPGVGRGSGVEGRYPDWQSERTSRGSLSRDSREQTPCERWIEARCKAEGGASVLQ